MPVVVSNFLKRSSRAGPNLRSFSTVRRLRQHCGPTSPAVLRESLAQKTLQISRGAFGNMSFSTSTGGGIIQQSIEKKLAEALKPVHLKVLNESDSHNVPKGSETHFKVIVVSEVFEGLMLIKRHREVNELLTEELEQGVHALSIVAKTPAQWEKSNNVHKSPNCMGGSKR